MRHALKRMAMTVGAAVLLAGGFAGAAQAQRHGGGFHGGFNGGFHGGFGGGFHRGFRGGFFFGGPVYDPLWYGPNWGLYYPYYGASYYSPYPYYYPPYTDYSADAPEPALPPAQGWYYCGNPRGYYPAVPSCDTEWQYVPSRP